MTAGKKKPEGPPTMEELFGPVISRYTRAQAIEDGFLVDVSEMAREAGIRFPVALTRAVWDEYVTPDPRSKKYGQSESGRLWDTLWMFSVAARQASDAASVFLYRVIYVLKEKQRRTITLKAHYGPGDEGEPVITISKPDED
jgi:hypothetical protein